MGFLKKLFAPVETSGKNNPLEYVSIIQDFQRFRGSARADGDYYDFPNHVFFKILFHFQNNSDSDAGGPGPDGVSTPDSSAGTGLLAPTWFEFGDENPIKNAQAHIEELWEHSSAWSYLVMNNEITRANNLKQFIEMLSNISSNTPWYFQNIKGLETATDRQQVMSGDFQFKPERDKLSIECLQDAYDMRIGTMLDLYRSVVWSWETKREMVPANLRKFDMTIIAFQMPIKGLNAPRGSMSLSNTIMRNETKIVETNDGFAIIYDNGGVEKSQKLTSYKAWEFHGCEFDYNSSKSSYDSISNATGTTFQPTIDILYDDCYEVRFNEWLGHHISDLMGDAEPTKVGENTPELVFTGGEGVGRRDTDGTVHELPKVNKENVPEYTGPDDGYVAQVTGGLLSWGKTKLKKIYLGNLNGLSISKIGQQIGELDNLSQVVGAVKEYTTKDFNGNRDRKLGDIFPEPDKRAELERIKHLGNIYQSKTQANS